MKVKANHLGKFRLIRRAPFPGMTMNSATATGWWTSWSTWPPRSKSLLDHQPQQDRGPQLLGSPCPNLIPQHMENLLTSNLHPRPRGRGEAWGALPCHVPSIKYTVPSQKKKKKEEGQDGGRVGSPSHLSPPNYLHNLQIILKLYEFSLRFKAVSYTHLTLPTTGS